MWMFVVVAILLVAVYLLIPSATSETPSPAGMSDFNFPDNSIGKPVTRLYGKARLYGNCIYAGGLRNEKIEVCQ